MKTAFTLFSLLFFLSLSNNLTSQVNLQYGDSFSGTISTPAEVDSYTFSGQSGDRIIIRANTPGSAVDSRIELYDPIGNLVGSHQSFGEARIDATLTASGTFTLLFMDLSADETGSYTLSLQKANIPPVATSIAYNDSQSGTLTNITEMDAFTFSGQSGDRVIIRANTPSSEADSRIELYDPIGNLVGSHQSFGEARIDVTLTANGTFTLLFMDLSADETGSYTLSLQKANIPPVATPIAYNDSQSGTLTNITEMDAFTFSGQSGDRVIIRANTPGSEADSRIELYDPIGNLVGSHQSFGEARIDVTLTANGTFTLLFMDLSADETGSYTLSLQKANIPPVATPIAYNDSQSGTLTNITEMDAFTFSGQSGDRVIIRANTPGSEADSRIELYDPIGNLVGSHQSFGEARIDVTLTANGTFTLLFMDLSADETGSYTLSLQKANIPPVATPIAYNDSQSGTLTNITEMDAFTFSGQSGDRVIIRANTPGSEADSRIELYDPIGNLVGSHQSFGEARIDVTLTANGTFTLLFMDLSADETGSYTLSLQKANIPPVATPIAYNDSQSGTLTNITEMDAFTFSGQSGDRVIIRANTPGSEADSRIELYDPIGNLVGSHQSFGEARIDVTLTATGTFTLLFMDLSADNTGSYTLSLQKANAPACAEVINCNTAINTSLGFVTEMDAFSFKITSASADIQINMVPIGSSIDPRIELYDSNGNLIGSDQSFSEAIIEANLLAPGTYTIIAMDLSADETGSYELSLTLLDGQCQDGCPSNRSVNQNPIPDGTYRASNELTSTGTVEAGSTVVFKAGVQIRLLPGFTVENDSYFWAKIDDCSVIEPLPLPPVNNQLATEVTASTLKVYPNPSDGWFNISFSGSQAESSRTITIFNTSGKVVWKAAIPFDHPGNVEVNLAGQPRGLYLLKFQSETEVITEKMMLQ